MAMHLLVVNEQTLPVHLEYGFAGVAFEEDCSWQNVTISGNRENAQAGLYADICRVHEGDNILFYLERPHNDTSREGGRFFGIFTVLSDRPFYEPQGHYLRKELGKPLIYRLLIAPKVVYRLGLTEWQLIDEMTDFSTVTEIPWSIIYRKLRGRRGCTPLLPHEEHVVCKMLDLRNAGQKLVSTWVSFDQTTMTMCEASGRSLYGGNTHQVEDIKDRLLKLMNNSNRQYEKHLQAYLLQEIKRDKDLTQKLFPNFEIFWIGNEIYCGAGLQSIDLLVYARNQLNTFVHLLELKAREPAGPEAARQINRYIKWLKAHIPDIRSPQIIPVIVAPEVTTEFRSELLTFLRGHGIPQYSEILYDAGLNFDQRFVLVA
ncbi:MAG: hypothetical protein AB1776_04590 [Bacillota bacterium]